MGNSVDQLIKAHEYIYGRPTIKNDLADAIGKMLEQRRQEQLKKGERQSDMYRTLRASGYDPEKAYEAVMKGELTPPGEQARTSDELIKEQDLKIKTSTASRKELEERITQKVANGESLTAGEQKFYDDVIKKKGLSDLSSALQGAGGESIIPGASTGESADGFSDADYIPMSRPDGSKTRVHKDDMQKALKKGYKRR
jgi:hypothetical protein